MLNDLLFRMRTIFSGEKYKIIFLDFDGVLCPIDDSIESHYDKFGPMFKRECIKNINEIVGQTNAKIVVTSSWRGSLSLWQLHRMWKKRNINGDIVGVTPDSSIHRGDEIDAWISKYGFDGDYVIIDDMNQRQFNTKHIGHLVTCNGRLGLTKEDAEQAIKILNKKQQL